MITLNEIHQNQVGELREFATTVQQSFRKGRELAFAGEGPAASVSDVANDDVHTFLHRTKRHTLGPVQRPDVERAFREPIEAAGREIGDVARIHPTRHGYVDFALPYLREYLRARRRRCLS